MFINDSLSLVLGTIRNSASCSSTGRTVNSKEQDEFHVERFLEKRDAHRKNVVKPLDTKVAKVYKLAHMKNRRRS